MAVTFTSNKGYGKPTVGTENGTWGPYPNANMDSLDNNLGGVATIALTNSPVTLSSAQYACAFVRFTGALTADCAITFPAVGSFYSIINDTTNSSAFVVQLVVSAGVQAIGVPVGVTDVLTDGTNAKFRSLPPVGTYLTIARSSTPRWVDACTVPPYLNCDGTTFSAVTYPGLAATLGSTTLPDTRGRVLAALDQGTGRLDVAGLIDGNTIFDGSDNDSFAINSGNLPSLSHVHAMQYAQATKHEGPNVAFNAVTSMGSAGANATQNTDATNPGGSADPFPVVQPTVVAGITLIRAG